MATCQSENCVKSAKIHKKNPRWSVPQLARDTKTRAVDNAIGDIHVRQRVRDIPRVVEHYTPS